MILETEGLSVHYFTRKGRVKAVSGVDLQVRKGETLGLVGESGCGKSTLGFSILRLVPPPGRIVAGKILFDGVNLVELNEEKMRANRGRRIAMIFQDPMTSLNPVLTIGEHFAEVLRTHEPEVGESEIDERVRELTKNLRISEERLDDFPHQFSGGMRQRVMIGLAMILHPEMIIADEPTTSLDVVVQAQILELLKSLRETFDLTLILITHNIGVVAETADRVAVMYAGHITEVSDVYSLFDDPQHPYTRLLLESVPNVSLDEQELKWIPGSPPDLTSDVGGCPFAPRCPYVMDRCWKEYPEPRLVGSRRWVSCHLYE